jgi:hypothetical protein
MSVATFSNIFEGVARNAQQSVNDIKSGTTNSTIAHSDTTGTEKRQDRGG